MAAEESLSKSLQVLNLISRHPEHFLDTHKKNTQRLKKSTKVLYDLAFEKLPVKKAVSELIVDNFDNEQIWEELELYNGAVISEFITDLSHLIAGKDRISFKTTTSLSSHQDQDADDDDGDGGSNDGEENSQSGVLGVDGINDDDNDDDNNDEESDEELQQIKSHLKEYEKLSGTQPGAESDFSVDSDEGDPNDLALEFQQDPADDNDGNNSKTQNEKGGGEGEEELGGKKKKKSKPKASVVDDKFFKLSEMEAFLEQQEALEAKRLKHGDDFEEDIAEEDDIDVFKDIESDDEVDVRNLKFDDFFRGPSEKGDQKRVTFADDDEEDEDENESGKEEEGEDVSEVVGGRHNKSTFELRQERLNAKIAKLEQASVSENPWQLKGEIGATARPENSLLEEHVQFDSTLKLPPEITEESTKTIEDIIIQRIKDQAWDDVERKSKVALEPFEYKKCVMLDQEKSKQSLGDIYEKQFLQQQQPDTDEKEKVNDPLHEEIDKKMNELFVKLDALSNFHFTPKMPISEVKIVSNLPSISMEEVAPVAVSDLQLVAPKELLEPLRSALKGKSEFSASDKSRQRKMKKKLYKVKQRERERQQRREEGLNPNSEKTEKAIALRKLEKQSKGSKRITILKSKDKKKVNSSADFFSRLQNEVRTGDLNPGKPSAKRQKLSHKSANYLKL
ncbi:U3 small nucleolar ribonucleoprotein protein MPP10-like [Argonauta hians]